MARGEGVHDDEVIAWPSRTGSPLRFPSSEPMESQKLVEPGCGSDDGAEGPAAQKSARQESDGREPLDESLQRFSGI